MKLNCRRQRGVSLIEAVVALAVMAFGMLALVGVQATLRSTGDVARQRNEALRIAQETMENYRAYAALSGTAGVVDFNEVVPVGRTAVDVTGTALEARINTVFYRTITVPTLTNSAPIKPVTVTVDWADRSGQYQAVELRSVIAGLPPELAGSLALPPARDASSGAMGRNRAIPLLAKSLPGTGTSVFKPPQGSAGGTVAWVFNNASGLITSVCTVSAASTTSSLTALDLTSCTATTAQLLSGYVRFAGGTATLAEAEAPTGTSLNLDVVVTLTSTPPSPPACFDDSTDSASLAATKVQVTYYCMIPSVTTGADTDRGLWAGRSRIAPLAFAASSAWTIAGSGSGNRKICRYTPLATDTGSRNFDHPLDYTKAGSPAFAGLTNQNFLVISADDSCPTETPAAGDFFNANTRLHQDGSVTYNNP